MPNCRPLRQCISNSPDELVIWGADNFAQFPRRDSSIRSSCDRGLASANQEDLVVLRGELDREYYDWLRVHVLGPDHIVDYKEVSRECSLAECIIKNPEPILKIIQETGRKPVYVPWFSGQPEEDAAQVLGAELFGASETLTLEHNDKSVFKTMCHQLDIPVVNGDVFSVDPEKRTNPFDMARVVNKHLATHPTVIIRGTVGEAGMSLYRTTGDDLPEVYAKIAATGEKALIIEPFLRVISSPNDQWAIERNGAIRHIGVADQICERGMVHIGTQLALPTSHRIRDYIYQTSRKIVQYMADSGYRGVLGLDYIVTDDGIYPVENNARFNGSSYTRLILDKIKTFLPSIEYWKFIKTRTQPCSFSDLTERISNILYDGERLNFVFPYNCNALATTGNFSTVMIGEDLNHLAYVEEVVNELGIKRN